MNAVCERVIGTVRRQCLDWLIPMSEFHLRFILKSWIRRYNATVLLRLHSLECARASGRHNDTVFKIWCNTTSESCGREGFSRVAPALGNAHK
jgi:hypothetical protein